MSMRFGKAFHMLSQANFPDEGSEKAVSFCDKTKLGGWATKYYLKRRQFPPHDGAPEKATTASGQDAALRPDDPHF